MVDATEDMMRRALFTPCETREHLARWIRVFLNIDFPDATVSEESNSNPLDMIWEVYNKARQNDDENFSRVMAYAGRGGFKTLGASVLEVLQVLHLGRNVAHMAAIFDQSKKSQEYVRDFFNKPYLRDFRSGQNVKKIELVCYVGPSGDYLNEREWEKLASEIRNQYQRRYNYIQIVLATMSGANSAHTEFMCVDGDTQIPIRVHGQERDRRTISARALFARIRGVNPSGRRAASIELNVESPAQKVEVLSVDPDTFGLRFSPVVRGHSHYVESRVEVLTSSRKLVCSKDHPLWVESVGYVPAEHLSAGQKLLALGKAKSFSKKGSRHLEFAQFSEEFSDSDEWDQVVLGSLMGDCGIYRKPSNNAYLREQHGLKQKEYLLWKREFLARKIRVPMVSGARSGYTGEPQVGYQSGCSPLLNQYLNLRKDFGGLERLGPLGLAIWYQDDGCAGNGFRLSTECWSEGENQVLADFLLNRFGIQVKVGSYIRDGRPLYYLHAGIEAKRKLVELCRAYVHPSMAYKFDLSANFADCNRCGRTFWYYERGNTARDCGRAECRAVATKTLRTEEVLCVKELGPGWVYDFTVEGTHNFFSNGLLSKNCVDEIDVIPKQNERAYEEAKHIPDPRDGLIPITLLTSTRKFSYGLVQREITKAFDTGLHVRHWNVIDITKPCEPERHKPELPRQMLWTNDSTLKTITAEEYALLDPQAQSKFVSREGYAGCASCPLFNACKGTLATKQTSTSPMLKPIGTIITQFKTASLSGVQTQLLCRKPDESGLIYAKFNREIHMKSPAEMATMMTGEAVPKTFNKAQLLQLMVEKGARFYAGMDFGFSHNFAAVVGAVFGQFMFVVTVIAAPGLELDEKIAICEPIKELNPTVFGDEAYPSDIKTFKRKGFNMRDWGKYPGSVKAGIEVTRMKLMPAVGTPQLFLLKDDPGCELLANRIEKYHFITDAGGQISEEPDKDEDDECFTAETEVLTKNGWRSLSVVDYEDVVLAVDSLGRATWEKPEVVIRKPYTGTLYKATHTHLEWTATEHHQHQVMSQYNWKVRKNKILNKTTVSELASESYWLNNVSEWTSGSGLFPGGPDEAWMAGFWLAEGCFDVQRPTYLIVDQTKKVQKEKVRATALKLGWHWTETVSKNSTRFIFSQQSDRAVFWRKIMGALSHEKKLDVESIVAMTSEERRAFWEGYMDGDGSRTGSGWHFDTVSKALADGMQTLTLSLGYGCRLVSYDCMRAGRKMTNPQGRTYNCRQSWRGHVLRKEPVTHLKKSKIEAIQADTWVYCIKTSKGGFFARTAGKPFVAGNCDALRYMVMNVFAPKGKIQIPHTRSPDEDVRTAIDSALKRPGQQDNWMQNKIQSLTGESSAPAETKTVKRGKFSFDG